jgi:hypothetical protein
MPDAVHLIGGERLANPVVVVAAGPAVTRRTARHRGHLGSQEVERDGARHRFRRPPGTGLLVSHKGLRGGLVEVRSANGAVARGRARHRVGFRVPLAIQPGDAGKLPGRPPRASPARGNKTEGRRSRACTRAGECRCRAGSRPGTSHRTADGGRRDRPEDEHRTSFLPHLRPPDTPRVTAPARPALTQHGRHWMIAWPQAQCSEQANSRYREHELPCRATVFRI